MKFRTLFFLASFFVLVPIVSAVSATTPILVTLGNVFSSAAEEPLIRAEIWLNGEFNSHTDIEGKFEILGTVVGDVIRVKKTDYVGISIITTAVDEELDFGLAPVWQLENAHQVYEDVPEYAWFEPAVRKLYETQTLSATELQNYKPSENLTRGELAVLGVRVAGFLPESVQQTNFCDISVEDDFAPAVEFMFTNGWLSGYPSDDCKKGRVFRPSLPVNRAEAVKMVLIAFRDLVDQKVEESVCLPSGFTDIPRDTWFTKFVDEANCLGFVNGYSDGSFRPANPVNRAEIAVILSNALESFF